MAECHELCKKKVKQNEGQMNVKMSGWPCFDTIYLWNVKTEDITNRSDSNTWGRPNDISGRVYAIVLLILLFLCHYSDVVTWSIMAMIITLIHCLVAAH